MLASYTGWLSANSFPSVRFQTYSQFAGQTVDGADFFRCGERDIGNGHRQLAGEQHGGEGLTHFAAHLILHAAARCGFLALTAMQS